MTLADHPAVRAIADEHAARTLAGIAAVGRDTRCPFHGDNPAQTWGSTARCSCLTGTALAVATIDAIPADDAKHARGALEDILLELVPADVRLAAIRLAKRCDGWPS